MNKIIDSILSRRSVRKFRDAQIDNEILTTLLNCGIHAPSAMNKQPWAVRVVQNNEILNKINQDFVDWAKGKQLQGSAARASETDFSVFHHSPTLIVIAADTENHYSKGDCGALAQNISLAAESMNIGTCVIGNVAAVINRSEYLKEILQIPDTYEVVFGIAIGYKNEEPASKPRDESRVIFIK
ncbi:MAG: nitroreductase [Prevotellaceae bacterium]|jgi:nitroreductase|nr:nitroreductase [Prevotellaceae bacterium]